MSKWTFISLPCSGSPVGPVGRGRGITETTESRETLPSKTVVESEKDGLDRLDKWEKTKLKLESIVKKCESDLPTTLTNGTHGLQGGLGGGDENYFAEVKYEEVSEAVLDSWMNLRPPAHKFPEDESFPVTLLGVDEKSYVYVKLVEASVYNKIVEMTMMIKREYRSNRSSMVMPFDKIKEGNIVIACTGSKGNGYVQQWWRAEVLVKNEAAETVLVSNVDEFGETKLLEKNSIFYLLPDIVLLPVQAIRCEIEGLSIFSETDIVQKAVKSLSKSQIGTDLTATVKWTDPVPKLLVKVNGNEDLAVKIREQIPEVCKVPIYDLGVETPVTVTHLSSDGYLWYQIGNNPLLDIIKNFAVGFNVSMDIIHQEDVRNFLNCPSKVFAVKYEDYYCRATVNAVINDDMVNVSYKDYGETADVAIDDLFMMEYDCLKNFNYIPPQARKVKLHQVNNINVEDVWSYLELSDEEHNVLVVKKHSANEEDIEVDILIKAQGTETKSLVSLLLSKEVDVNIKSDCVQPGFPLTPPMSPISDLPLSPSNDELPEEKNLKHRENIDLKPNRSVVEDLSSVSHRSTDMVDGFTSSGSHLMKISSIDQKLKPSGKEIPKKEIIENTEICFPPLDVQPPILPENSPFFTRLLGIDGSSKIQIQVLTVEAWENYSDHITRIKNKYRSSNELRPIPMDKIKEGMFVLTNILAADGPCIRGEVLQINRSTGEITCLDVDQCKEVEVSIDRIHYMTQEALELPFMTIRCSVDDLEMFDDAENLQLAYSKFANEDNPNYIANLVTPGRFPRVQLKSLSGISFADKLRAHLPYVCQVPVPPAHVPTPVIVTHVDQNGFIWYQVVENILLDKILSLHDIIDYELAVQNDSFILPVSKEQLQIPDLIVAALSNGPGGCYYYRAKIIEFYSDHKAKVDFIDFGNNEIVNINNILRMDTLSKDLSIIPPQARRVKLHGVPFDFTLVQEYIERSDTCELVVVDDQGLDVEADFNLNIDGVFQSLVSLLQAYFEHSNKQKIRPQNYNRMNNS